MSDLLTVADREQLKQLAAKNPLVRDVLRSLTELFQSLAFRRARQARRFLEYVVSMTLLGKADGIKESTIAVYVYGESAEFNPATSSKVRQAARDVRRRLRQ